MSVEIIEPPVKTEAQIHNQIDTLMGLYCDISYDIEERHSRLGFTLIDEVVNKNRLDWSIRSLAADAEELDPELRYLLATYGAEEGLAPSVNPKLEELKKHVGELVLIPKGKHTADYAYLGRFEQLDFYTSWSLYAFDNLDMSEDQPGIFTGVYIHMPKVLQIDSACTVFYGHDGPYHALNEQPATARWNHLPVFERHAITYPPVPYSQNREGVLFSEPISYYDSVGRSLYDLRQCCPPRPILIGQRAVEWFDKYTKPSEGRKLLDIYQEILDQETA